MAEVVDDVQVWTAKSRSATDVNVLMAELQKHLADRVFVAGDEMSSADVALFEALHSTMTDGSWTDESRVAKSHLWRWFDLVQHRFTDRQHGLVEFEKDLSSEVIARGEKLTLAAAKPARPQLTEEERAAKAAEKKAAKEAKKANKKENPAPPQAKKEEDLSVTRLNIRVGKIVKAENHPDADALYVEQIDIGEEQPRTVCSGLRKYFPIADDLLGPCLVVANLKPVKMRGIVSQAMVLCATSSDKTTVELVMPPDDAPAGTKVTFEGEEGEADDVLNPKKQIFEKIAPELYTNDDCVATWKGKIFTTPQGVCTVKTVKNGGIK